MSDATKLAQVSVDVALLSKLIKAGHLCIADLSALDARTHQLLRHIALDACAYQLKGQAQACLQCPAQAMCKQQTEVIPMHHAALSPYPLTLH